MPLLPPTSPRIILGLMTFGPSADAGARITSPDEYSRVLDRFQERGYGEVDTARVYVASEQEAWTRDAGKWKERGLTLATKFRYPAQDGDNSGVKVEESLGESLGGLGTGCVDICYLHAADRGTPFADTLAAVDKLHKAGKFVRFGLSNFTAAEVAEVVLTCKYNGWVKPTIYRHVQRHHTRSRARADPHVPPLRPRHCVYNPIAGGLFSGKIKSKDMEVTSGRFNSASRTGVMYQKRYFKDSVFRALQIIEAAVEKQNNAHKEQNLTMIEVALRWIVHHSALRIQGIDNKSGGSGGNDGIIIGISSYDQLDGNLDAIEKGPLPEDVVKALDEAWDIAKAEAPNYWHKDLVYTYDTQKALFAEGAK
ncbi:aflatoxin B1 aldehyde reductase member 3 [Astrocystis sublimbata]|nr:aflatoxin B1 aldehyde reductase member 3 [Astrocystis sublimbata]